MTRRFILFGLAGAIWFGALFQAAYDLWAACVLFLLISSFVFIFSLRTRLQSIAIKLPLAPLVLLILGAVWLSAYHAIDIDTAILEAWGWTFAFCIFYLLLNTLENKTDWDRFLEASAFVLIPLALIGLWQQRTGHPDTWGHWEIQATLINSLVLAGFALHWVYFLSARAWKGNRLSLVLLIACFIILALARSWWSFICLFVGFLFDDKERLFQWFEKHRRLGWSSAAIVLILLAAAVAIKVRVHVGPYKGSSRSFYWLTALKIWRQSPWTGVGLGGFATAYPYFRDPRVQSTLFAHSFPLQWLSETGIVGIFCLIMLAGGTLKIFCSKSMHQTAGNEGRAFKTTLFVILLFSLLSIHLEYLLNKILLLVILAAALSSYDLRGYRIKPLWISVFSISLCLLSPFWLRMFFGSQSYMRGLTYEREGRLDQAQAAYLAAVSMDPYLAESYHALSHLYWRQFMADGSPQTRLLAIQSIQQAIRCQKKLLYIEEIQQYAQERRRDKA